MVNILDYILSTLLDELFLYLHTYTKLRVVLPFDQHALTGLTKILEVNIWAILINFFEGCLLFLSVNMYKFGIEIKYRGHKIREN